MNLLSSGVTMMRERRYYVYIMASKSRVIYVGITGFLMARVLRHKAGAGGEVTRIYHVPGRGYYHGFLDVGHANPRERLVNERRREVEVALVRAENDT